MLYDILIFLAGLFSGLGIALVLFYYLLKHPAKLYDFMDSHVEVDPYGDAGQVDDEKMEEAMNMAVDMMMGSEDEGLGEAMGDNDEE